MKAVLQRVTEASVEVEGEIVGRIDHGLLVLIGFEKNDQIENFQKTLDKIPKLRVFVDESGKMNRSLIDTKGSLLLVSQFTLISDTNKGLRPFFGAAEEPTRAEKLFKDCVQHFRKLQIPTETGRFGALMTVKLVNDGPITLIVES